MENLTTAQQAIEDFKLTRWYEPTLLRYRAHLDACDSLECPELKESFLKFIDEVMSAPEPMRDSMLEMKPVEPYIAFQRYEAYVTPTVLESKLDFYSARMGNKMR